MGRSYFDRDQLDALKQDDRRLRDEFGEARGAGKSTRYRCPFGGCGGKYSVSVFRGRDGAAMFHCYGCGASGTIIDLLQLRDGLNVYEAMQQLIGADGSPRRRPDGDLQPRDVTQIQERWRADCRAYCEAAAAQLWNPAGRPGLEYLHGRGFDDDTLRRFRVGFDARATGHGAIKYGAAAVILPYSRRLDYYCGRLLRPRTIGDKVLKSIQPARDRTGLDGEPLFNAAALRASDVVLIVEGQLDALAIAQASTTISGPKIAAVALNGASSHRALIAELLEEQLERPAAARLLIALDDDDTGLAESAKLSAKLTAIGQQHEVISGIWTAHGDGTTTKDAADVLQIGGTAALAAAVLTVC